MFFFLFMFVCKVRALKVKIVSLLSPPKACLLFIPPFLFAFLSFTLSSSFSFIFSHSISFPSLDLIILSPPPTHDFLPFFIIQYFYRNGQANSRLLVVPRHRLGAEPPFKNPPPVR